MELRPSRIIFSGLSVIFALALSGQALIETFSQAKQAMSHEVPELSAGTELSGVTS